MTDIKIKSERLSPQTCIDFVTSDEAGAIDVFIGTVRNQTNGKAVVQLDFESYEPMAISEMKKIADRAFEKYPARKIAIHHRVGTLSLIHI